MTRAHDHDDHDHDHDHDAAPSAIDRRDFLRVAAAGAAMLAAAGCSRAPREKIFPYVVQPPELVPGRRSSSPRR